MSVVDSVLGVLGAGAGTPPGKGTGKLKADSGHGKTVGASMYGGPTDASTKGDTGYKGDHLTGKMAYAELGMGTALGGLPYKAQLRITNPANGKSVVAEKLDIGAGGSPVQGHARRIDLWYQTAQALGFGGGTGLVQVEQVTGQPITLLAPTQAGVDAGNAVVGAIGGAWSSIISALGKLLNIKTILGIVLVIIGLARIAGVV